MDGSDITSSGDIVILIQLYLRIWNLKAEPFCYLDFHLDRALSRNRHTQHPKPEKRIVFFSQITHELYLVQCFNENIV